MSILDEALAAVQRNDCFAAEKIERLLPFAQEERHPMIAWVWFNLALSFLELGDKPSFDHYSAQFCFSDQTNGFHYRVAKIELLRRRIQFLRETSRDAMRESVELLSLEPTEHDLNVLDEELLSRSRRNIETFGPDEETVLPLDFEVRPPEPAAITAKHFSIESGCRSLQSLSSAPAIQTVHNAEYLYFRNESAVIKEGRFFRFLSRSDSIRKAYATMTQLCVEPVRLRGTAVILNDLFGPDNYCHWMLDWWPRLLLAHRFKGPIHWICTRLGRLPYHFESRDLDPGLRHAQWLVDEGVRWYRFDTILTVDNFKIGHNHPCWKGNTRVMELMRDAVLSATAGRVPSPDWPKRVYISRRESNVGRAVINEAELEKVLRKYGFHTVVLTGMTLAEQGAIFSRCEAVIGVHGAGLANLFFMPPASIAIELFHYRYGTWAYFAIAHGRGLRYHYMSCDSRSGSTDPYTVQVSHSSDYHFADVWVDTEILDAKLRDLFGTLGSCS